MSIYGVEDQFTELEVDLRSYGSVYSVKCGFTETFVDLRRFMKSIHLPYQYSMSPSQ